MLFLAQIEPPAGFSAFASSFMYIVVSLAAIVGLWQMLRPKGTDKTELAGQPIEVRENAGHATRSDLEQTHGRITRERKEIDNAISVVRDEARQRAEKLEGKLDRNTELTGEMRGEVRQMNQTLSSLAQTLTHFMRDAARK
jgi:hypothetical protein